MSDLATRWPALRDTWRRLVGSRGEGPLTPAERTRAARGIARLSERLTRERHRIGERYLDDAELLAAYVLFYWPVSYAQARSIFGELGALGRVLDLGAGPLPMSWAALDAGATSVRALERVAAARELGRSLGAGNLEVAAWDAMTPLPTGFDTIVAGHLVNELDGSLERRTALVQGWLSRLDGNGRVVIIEPALRESSRALLALRDRLIDGGAVVIAPCLMQAHCPALVKESDWCHAERAFSPPDEHGAIADEARIHKDRLKLSYLVLARTAAPRYHETLYRIVSEPLDEKGKQARIGCGPAGRVRLVLRTRDRGERNAALAQAARGDVLLVEGLLPRGDGRHLTPEGRVERIAAVGAPPPEPAS
jgi:ribosomal protein RSM22 (predicted rRNA methylase)